MFIKVLSPGFLTTVQDLGRYGYGRFGVPVSGGMDRFALCAANQLVGNSWESAVLEFGIEGPTLEFEEDCVIAVTGAGFSLLVQDKPMPMWTSIIVRRGWRIQIVKEEKGTWSYLGISGGVHLAPVLSSQATYLRGGFGGMGGAALKNGDLVPIGRQPYGLGELAGHEIPRIYHPKYTESPTLDIILGPQDERFTQEGIDTFLANEYSLSLTSDRMGYRLEGPPVKHSAGADILSDGMVFGSVQIPPNGQPIIMMSECPTTGGYTKIATVASVDLPVLAQTSPGISRIRFQASTVEAAQARLRELYAGLKNAASSPEDDLMGFAG
jgi:antagonist of KipI